MKKYIFALIAVLAISLTSCKETVSTETKEVSVDTTTVDTTATRIDTTGIASDTLK